MKYIIWLALSLTSLGSLSQNGSIEGTVSFEDEAGLSATTEIIDEDMYTITDQNNAFSFQNLPEGTYKLKVTSLGYVDLIKSVTGKRV